MAKHLKFAWSDDEDEVKLVQKTRSKPTNITVPILPGSQVHISQFLDTFLQNHIFQYLPVTQLATATSVCKHWMDLVTTTIHNRLLNEARYRLSNAEILPLWKFFMNSSPMSTLPSQLQLEDFSVSAPEQVDILTNDLMRTYQIQNWKMKFPQGTLTNEFDWTVTLRSVIPLSQFPKPFERGQQQAWFDMVISNGEKSHSLLKHFKFHHMEQQARSALYNVTSMLRLTPTELVPLMFVSVVVAGLPLNAFVQIVTDFINYHELLTPAQFVETFEEYIHSPNLRIYFPQQVDQSTAELRFHNAQPCLPEDEPEFYQEVNDDTMNDVSDKHEESDDNMLSADSSDEE